MNKFQRMREQLTGLASNPPQFKEPQIDRSVEDELASIRKLRDVKLDLDIDLGLEPKAEEESGNG